MKHEAPRLNVSDLLLAIGVGVTAIMLFGGASCRPPKPPVDPCQGVSCPPGQECRGGTCVPIEPPPPTGTPAKGVPYKPEMLLRVKDGRLTTLDGTPYEFVQAEPCCMSWITGKQTGIKKPAPWRVNGVEKNTGWPLASPEWQDYVGTRGGVNAYHFRGPWRAGLEGDTDWGTIGGQYLPGPEMAWNDTYWQLERDWVYHAAKQGRYVEKTIVDSWGCKVSQNGDEQYNPWKPEDVQACGRTWTAEHERYTRKVVEELGCFGNVVWITGNEETTIFRWDADWFRKMRDVVRDEELKSGCNFVHIFGTGVPDLYSEFDYAVTHDRKALVGPLYPGKWSLQNEHNPEFDATTEVSYFSLARGFGGSWALWRGGASDEQYGRVLDGVKSVLAGNPPPEPPPAGTLLDDELLTPKPNDTGNQMSAAVDQARAAYQRAQPQDWKNERCLTSPSMIDEAFRDLASYLAQAGIYGAQSVKDDGTLSDAIFVNRPGTSDYEERHVYEYGGGCWVDTNWRGVYSYGGSTPPPPNTSGCPAPLPDRAPDKLQIKIKPHHQAGIQDATITTQRQLEYCQSIGMGEIGGVPRADCPMRSECPGFQCELRPPCEMYAARGATVWQTIPAGMPVERIDGNPWQARCQGCSQIRVCVADLSVCSEWVTP